MSRRLGFDLAAELRAPAEHALRAGITDVPGWGPIDAPADNGSASLGPRAWVGWEARKKGGRRHGSTSREMGRGHVPWLFLLAAPRCRFDWSIQVSFLPSHMLMWPIHGPYPHNEPDHFLLGGPQACVV